MRYEKPTHGGEVGKEKTENRGGGGVREGEVGRGRFYIISANLNKTASSVGGKDLIYILETGKGPGERHGRKSIEVIDTA